MWASRVIEVGRSEHAQPAEPQSYTHPIRSRGEARSPLYRATIALLFALSPLASAAPDVSTTGDANPAIPATSNPVDLTGTSLLLGGTNGAVGLTGSLNVSGGGNLKVGQISAGYGGLGTGTVTLDGAGSTVTFLRGANPFGGLDIGGWGTGSMSVTNGAKVICTISDCQFNDVGGAAGANGTLTISGPGSSVTGVGLLNIGQANTSTGYGTPGGTTTGTLVIQNGGVLGTMGNSSISAGAFGNAMNGSEHTVGNVTINGAGSIWSVTQDPVSLNQAAINIAATPNATATVSVTNGGHFDLAGTQSYMAVGDGGSATLTIASGGQVSVGNMALGNQTTGVGTVTVGNGVGQSTLTVTNSMGVGNSSTALSQLTVNAGGKVDVTGTNGLGIAGSAGSQGKVLVDGGQLNVNGTNAFFGVGNSGTGTLTIQNGGAVSAVNLGLGNATTGVGTVTVGNGVGQSVLTVTNSMGVGNSSTALSQLTVNTGGKVDVTGPGGLGVGNSPGSTGKVLVDGGQLNVNGTNASLGVGNSGTGFLTVQAGGTVTAGSLSIANQAGSSGTVDIVGTGNGNPQQTVLNITGPAAAIGLNPLQVGNWGNGTMTVSNGAIVNVAVNNANCATTFCGNYVGNGAGSTASLTVTGAGTTANIGGSGFFVGNASVFTNPPTSFTFGTPGGTTNATVKVLAGATLNTYQAVVSTGPTGSNPTGSEHTIAHVVVDGSPSIWSISPNANTGDQAFLSLAQRPNATATIDITGGAVLVIEGGVVLNGSVAGINMSGNNGQVGGTSTINVAGIGSALIVNGDTGVINVGRNGGTATLAVSNGGQVYSDSANGLLSLNIGRQGSHGFLTIDGAGSQVTVSGVGSPNSGSNGVGAGGSVGRENGSVGSISVTNGGLLLVSDGGQNAVNGGVGFTFGRDLGASGSLVVSGPGSSVIIEQTGSGSTRSPGMTIGSGGNGDVSVTAGANVLISDTGLGGGGILIAANAGSTGSLTVSGIGSSLTVQQTGADTVDPGITIGRAGTGTMTVTDGAQVFVNGQAQRNLIVGNAVGGTGALSVSNGAQVSASWFAVGNQGGSGTATINNATVLIDGLAVNPDDTIFGGSVRIGRGTGSVGTLNLQNGAQLVINTSVAGSSVNLGGTSVLTGGNGTINMTGGSSISFVGSSATPSMVVGHSGTGLLTMSNSSLSLPSDGTVSVGRTSTGSGTLTMTGTSTIQTGDLIVGHAGVGVFNQSGGVTNATNLFVGNQPTGNGTVNLTGGALNVSGEARIGNDGTGAFIQSAGNTFVGNGLLVGTSATFGAGTGAYQLSGGTLTTGSTTVGDKGTGTFNQSGGTHTTNSLDLANCGGCGGVNSSGTYNLSGSGVLVAGTVTVGGFGRGEFNQSGTSTATIASNLVVGSGPEMPASPSNVPFREGSYALSGGSLTVGGNVVVGAGNGFFQGEPGGKGTFTQSGGTHTVSGNLVIGQGSDLLPAGANAGASAGANGTYVMSGGTLAVGGSVTIGGAGAQAGGTGTLVQTGGSTTIGNQLVIGDGPGSTGTMSVSGGSTLTLTGAGATVVIGQNGTGVMTMIEGSTLALPGSGKVIVGASGTASGTLELQGGSSIQAGALFAIGHNGTNPTGAAAANVYLDQGSSVTATNIYLGDGCLGGNGGVLHGNFVMDGQGVVNCAPPVLSIVHPDTVGPLGILHPGRSPGVLVFDGSFQYLGGTIVLEVQSDGLGGFITDELIFADGTIPDLTNVKIEFAFLGATDPNAFADTGDWILDTFLKIVLPDDGNPATPPVLEGISALGGLVDYGDPDFAAQSDTFVFETFTFTTDSGVYNPDTGESTVVAVPAVDTVPEPGTLALFATGMALLMLYRQRRKLQLCRSSHFRASTIASS